MDGEIDGAELQALVEDGEDLRVVDIRQPKSFRQGHIPGSTNVPFGDLPDRIDDIADADRVVTVCPHGKASVKAARLVGSYQNFDGRVESLDDGLEAWEGPVETGEGDETVRDGNETDGEGSQIADAGSETADGGSGTDTDGSGTDTDDSGADGGPAAPF